MATASGTRPTPTIQPSFAPSQVPGGYNFSPQQQQQQQQQQQPQISSSFQNVSQQQPQTTYTSNVAYPSPMEPKLRAVVPQPGTVPSQQFGQGNFRICKIGELYHL